MIEKWRMKGTLALCAALSLAPALALALAADNEAPVRAVLMAQFDKPEARLQVQPVVVSGDAAIASWAQDGRGGRALLMRHHGQWRIVACAGDAFKDVAVLRDAGVDARHARALVDALGKAEARLPAADRAKFSMLDRIVPMSASGSHP